jgi:hypothetical protein
MSIVVKDKKGSDFTINKRKTGRKDKKKTVSIVIYITNAVGYILQREVLRLKHARKARVF